MDQHLAPLKPIGEAVSIATVIGTIAGWLPPLAALAAILWYGVLFYDRFRPKRDRSQDGMHY